MKNEWMNEWKIKIIAETIYNALKDYSVMWEIIPIIGQMIIIAILHVLKHVSMKLCPTRYLKVSMAITQQGKVKV